MYVCMYKGLRKSICPPQKKKKKSICMVFINLKDNEKPTIDK